MRASAEIASWDFLDLLVLRLVLPVPNLSLDSEHDSVVTLIRIVWQNLQFFARCSVVVSSVNRSSQSGRRKNWTRGRLPEQWAAPKFNATRFDQGHVPLHRAVSLEGQGAAHIVETGQFGPDKLLNQSLYTPSPIGAFLSKSAISRCRLRSADTSALSTRCCSSTVSSAFPFIAMQIFE
jgi:hypothetical protein